MSVRTQVRDAIISALNADRPSHVPEATRRRWISGRAVREAEIGVFFIEEQGERGGGRHGPLMARQLKLAVQCRDVTDEPSDLDDLVEPLLEWSIGRLVGNQLGGLAHDIREVRSVWEPQAMDRLVAIATVIFEVDYQTLKADLTKTQ